MSTLPTYSKDQVRLRHFDDNTQVDNDSEKTMTQACRNSEDISQLENGRLVSDRKSMFEALPLRYGAKFETFRKAYKTEDLNRNKVPLTSRPQPQPDKLDDANVSNDLRDSGIEEGFRQTLDDDTNTMDDHIYDNVFRGIYLGGNRQSAPQLAYPPIPMKPRSRPVENIYETVKYDYVHYENAVPSIPPRSSSLFSNPKLELVIQELIDTEKTYIDSMEFFIQEYLKYFLNHPERRRALPGITVIFDNIESLYESSKKILADFIQCNSRVDCIANIFRQSKQLFKLYEDYLRNKAQTMAIVENIYKTHLKQRQTDLKDKNSWDFYLIAPLQRPLRYKLLLERLQNELKKLGKENKNLEAAIAFVGQNNELINSLIAIDSIKNCPIDIVKFGGLHLLKDKFNIKRKYKSVVFLFEGIIIFTTKNKHQKETYDYKDSINSNVLGLRKRSKTNFIVSNHSECKFPDGEGPFSFDMENSSEVICGKWAAEIGDILLDQFHQFKHVLKKK